jgi:hypothetical protein
MLDQQLIETSTTTSDGEKKKASYLEQSHFAVACSMDDALTLFPLDIDVKLDSPSAGKCAAEVLHICLHRSPLMIYRGRRSLQSLIERIARCQNSNPRSWMKA